MTTDDDMREIEAALDNLIAVERDRALDGIGETRKMRGDLLALIRQKLAKRPDDLGIDRDAAGLSARCLELADRLVRQSALSTAAGELLRAAKALCDRLEAIANSNDSYSFGDQADDLERAKEARSKIEAAERAGVR